MKLPRIAWLAFVLSVLPVELIGSQIHTVRPEEVGLSSERLERITSKFAREIDDGRLAGAIVAVSRRGKLAYFETLGDRDREVNADMTRDTIFRIYSMTKPVTSVAAMILYEEGHYTLNDTVSRFLPELEKLEVLRDVDGSQWVREPAKREMTIRDLLRHTSGLTSSLFDRSRVGKLYVEAEVSAPDVPTSELVKKLGRLPLRHHPATVWNYGVSTDVLGRLIEVVANMPLDEFLAKNIFDPLDMRDTGFHVPEPDTDRLTQIYVQDEGGGIRPGDAKRFDVSKPPARLAGGSGLVSTTMDYLRFCQMLLNGGELEGARILSRKSVELMTTDHLVDVDTGGLARGYGFGLGFAVARAQGHIGAIGSVGEYNWAGAGGTFFFVDPREELVAIFMIQNYFGPSYISIFNALVYQAIID